MATMDTAFGLLAFSQRQLDRFISPEARSRVYDRVQAFASARPLLFTFIIAQVLTSLLPIALFLAFTSSVLALSVGAALLFSLFWLGVALLFLIPALFITVSLGFLVFLWALAARFAWFALPARVKTSITAGRPRSSNGSGNNANRNDHKNGHYSAAQYPSYAAVAAAGAGKDIDNGRDAETNGSPSHGMSDEDDYGVTDLKKFKEEKEGTITP